MYTGHAEWMRLGDLHGINSFKGIFFLLVYTFHVSKSKNMYYMGYRDINLKFESTVTVNSCGSQNRNPKYAN